MSKSTRIEDEELSEDVRKVFDMVADGLRRQGEEAGYRKGYDRGIREANMLNETKSGTDDYAKGLRDSWDIVLKLFDMTADELNDLFDMKIVHNIVDTYSPEYVAEKIKQAAGNIIESGSEFDIGVVGYVISKLPQANTYNVVFSDGSVGTRSGVYLKDHLTGDVNRALAAVLNMNKEN